MNMRFFPLCLLVVVANSLAGELTMQEAYELALNNDARLQMARYQLDATQAREDSTFARVLPRVTAFGQFSQNEVRYDSNLLESREYDGTRYGLSLSQTLFNKPIFSQIAAAKARTGGVGSRFDDEVQLLAVRTADAYLSVLSARKELKAFTDELVALEQQSIQSKAMADRQLISVTELLEVNARRDLVKTRQINAENNLARAREEFFLIVGSRDYLPVEIAEAKVMSVPDTDIDKLVKDALATNPKIASLEAEQRAARATIDSEWGTFFPNLELVVNQQYSDVGFDNTTSPPRNTFFVGLNVNWALVEGGAGRARLREAWANYYGATEKLKLQRQEVERDIRSISSDLQSSGQRIDAARQSKDSALMSFNAAEKALQLGSGRTVDVLLSRSAATRAELNLTSAYFDNYISWLRLKYVTGNLSLSALAALE